MFLSSIAVLCLNAIDGPLYSHYTIKEKKSTQQQGFRGVPAKNGRACADFRVQSGFNSCGLESGLSPFTG